MKINDKEWLLVNYLVFSYNTMIQSSYSRIGVRDMKLILIIGGIIFILVDLLFVFCALSLSKKCEETTSTNHL